MRSFRASILWRKKGLPQALTRQLTVRLLRSRAVFMPPPVKVRDVPVDFCCCNRIGYLETAAQASVNCHKFFDTRNIYSQDFLHRSRDRINEVRSVGQCRDNPAHPILTGGVILSVGSAVDTDVAVAKASFL